MGQFKVIRCANEYRAYTNECEVFDTLPPKAYKVCFHKMGGYWLEETEMQHFSGKLYGDVNRRVTKVFRTFEERSDRNLGILLSGGKGLGKSCLAKEIARTAIEKHNLPVIIVAKNIGSSIVEFLQSLNTNCVILFDEFDKTFPGSKGSSHDAIDEVDGDSSNATKQDAFLSFFDGVGDKTHKIIVCTCNEISKCSNYMINRPGRLFYHFRFTAPSRDQTLEYYTDNISKEHSGKIEQLVNISCAMQLSFDSMEALCFEINHGESVENALDDLNIVNGFDSKYYIMHVELSNGTKANERIKVSGDDFNVEHWVRFNLESGGYTTARIIFPTKDMKFNPKTGGFTVENATISSCDDEEAFKNVKITSLTLENCVDSTSSGRSIFELLGNLY